jgi:hypothetical protein
VGDDGGRDPRGDRRSGSRSRSAIDWFTGFDTPIVKGNRERWLPELARRRDVSAAGTPWLLVGASDRRAGVPARQLVGSRLPAGVDPYDDDGASNRALRRGGARDRSGGRMILAVIATAYCLTGHTATGTLTRPGTIAVDPRVIPLGSIVHVPGYGYAPIARDTGAAIKALGSMCGSAPARARARGVRRLRIRVGR